MNCSFLPISRSSLVPLEKNFLNSISVSPPAHLSTRIYHRKPPRNLRYPRHTKLPPDFGVNLFLKKPTTDTDTSLTDSIQSDQDDSSEEEVEDQDGDIVWESDEIEAISSLFQGRIPQKPGKLGRERPLPLPLPHKLRPLGLPTPKKHIRSSRASISKEVYKNPSFLSGLAREIKDLASDQDASVVLCKWARFLRKGSLSLTIRELGQMGLPERALQTFCWAEKQPTLFPDDRVLASTVEVLARHHQMKVPLDLKKFTSMASRNVIEAMARGFIRAGSLKLAWKLLLVAKHGKRMLDSSVYAKLIYELGKNPDKHQLVAALLDDLGEREDLNLSQQDCTAIMKVCVRLGRFDIVESLFSWFKQSGRNPSVVLYTTLIHSRYSQMKYREALAVVWEMETSECLLDLPAFRVVIKLFFALNDLPRAVRYFAKMKEAGFSPTYDIYRDMINVYLVSGRLARCKEICKEAEMAGFKLDNHTTSRLSQLEKEISAAVLLVP
ncbi:hypothetical protein SLEP1_g55159 [Rubroshorea leprosula]|uniref:Pentatricopeptide repeat-containing protein n=1 Tax=Rubroshorea leprosula TaxID=152421 RepID=A0AAV5MEV6_9ROSI|nr:hypothetical protein SLEP1_g55159 [Rubroshorea leprosula]